MLAVEGISAGYNGATVLRGLNLYASAGKVTCIMGRNGVGKTTVLRAIMGQVALSAGSIRLNKEVIDGLPAHQVGRLGIGFVPQGRRLFGPMTVAENLEVGLQARNQPHSTRDRVLDLFPRLRERMGQAAGTLSGGEQQMLAIARALCMDPKVLLLDEPTEGLQPSMIALIRDVVVQLKSTGVATVLVEQRPDAVLRVADSVAFMEHGHVAEWTDRRDLQAGSPQFAAYVGV